MKYFHLVYIVAILLTLFLWKMNTEYQKETVYFYGFAENKETEINLDHPIRVQKIHVSTGEAVKQGALLAQVTYEDIQENITEYQNNIAELRTKKNIWVNEKKARLKQLEVKKNFELENMDGKIRLLQTQVKYQEELIQGLENISPHPQASTYNPVANEIEELQNEKEQLALTFDKEILIVQDEIRLDQNPYQSQIRSIQSKIDVQDSKKTSLTIEAPTDGLIGNIQCKEAEYITSFKTLFTFYEPNPTLVKGYVHESLILHVKVGDSFSIVSTKNEALKVQGMVSGLGSRIVEIPERLRKIPEIKSYGREVLIKIPRDNEFLQKEKVVIQFEAENKNSLFLQAWLFE